MRRRPNWKIINQVRREKKERNYQNSFRQVEPGVYIKIR